MDGILFMAFPRGQEKAEEVPIIIQFGFVRWKLILSLYSHFLCSREMPCPEKRDHIRILGISHFKKIGMFIVNLTGYDVGLVPLSLEKRGLKKAQ